MSFDLGVAQVEDALRNSFIAESKAYQLYRREKWNECKSNGGFRRLLDQDPLEEWPKIADKFPMLALLAEYILSIPAASAGAERFFSALTKIITKDRCSIERKFAGDLIASHMRHRKAKPIVVQVIPNFGEIIKKIVIQDWEEMYDLDYERDEGDELEDDLLINDADFVSEEELSSDEDIDTELGKRKRLES